MPDYYNAPMEQRIGFCTASDGVTIAYATIDNGGPTVIYVAGFPSHLEIEWERPTSRTFLTALATDATLVRYDLRGTGLSDRDASDVSIAAFTRDLEAVVSACGMEQFSLLGLGMLAGPTALTYASSHPRRVARVVLVSAFARGDRLAPPERQQALIEYTGSAGFPVLEYSESPDPAAALDRTGRDVVHLASSPAQQAALLRLFFSLDVTPILPHVTMPVTVIHGRDDRLVPYAEGRALAAQLPNAEFVSFEGNTGSALTERGSTIPVVRRALGLPPLPETFGRPSATVAHDTAIILFADIVESTALTEKIGDDAFRERARALDLAMRTAIVSYQGTAIEGKLLGDGVLATFASARHAIECGRACVSSAAEADLELHVGIHAGDVIRELTNVYGGAVNIASRIASVSSPNQVLVSETVRSLARTSAGVQFIDKGEHAMKGIDEPQRVFEVLWP